MGIHKCVIIWHMRRLDLTCRATRKWADCIQSTQENATRYRQAHVWFKLTLPMLRLLLSKVQGCSFLKTS